MDINGQIAFLQKKVMEEKRDIFEKFRLFLLEYNEKYNLTTIVEEKDIYYKHFLDSAVGEGLFAKNARSTLTLCFSPPESLLG